ncbi:AT-hook motif nuclear-localized protein 10 isoform X2 [Canna indica]|uniref:AT-hook motif nuclear-localized protein n=1 Tax=Canna indica TaxID=4628 RepID=A0AAQ3KRL6_9LILI|nr:AT-hook motif nuclear-localized protein 10 isoform X2 [Canna indica]
MEARPQPPLFNVKVVDGSNGVPVYEPLGSSSPSPYQGVAGGSNGPSGPGSSSGEPFKRKRGRPRKYGPDGKVILAVTPVSSSPGAPSSSGAFSVAANVAATAAAEGVKKGRGRPPGSSKKRQIEALGSAGAGFIPHIIAVNTGEDVSAKIMAFSQQSTRAICVLCANGAISNVTLRQAATSGGTVTYEGRFEILSLSGSFLLTENGGQRSRTGGLSVSLAGPDGHVLGGGVAGLLTAASPVQVIVGSFTADGKKEPEQMSAPGPASGSGKQAVPGDFMGISNPLAGSYSS